MQFANLPGLKLAFETAGDGVPVLLIMGLAVPGHAWRGQVPLLSPHHKLIWFDNRGVGQSEVPPGPYSMAQMAGDAIALLDHLGIEKAHVVGLSMGGMIAQHVALAVPHRLFSLTLIATHAGGVLGRLPSVPGIRAFVGTQIGNANSRRNSLKKMLFPPTFLANCDVAALDHTLELDFGTPVPRRALVAQIAAIQGHSTADSLPNLRLPTLVLRPDLDILVRPVQSDRLAALIPNAKLVGFADAGHGLIRQRPPQVAEQLLKHFAEHAPV